MFLDVAGDAVQVLGSLEAAELAPGGQGLASRLYRHVDVLCRPLGGGGQHLARGWGIRLILLPTLRVVPDVVDEKPKFPVVMG